MTPATRRRRCASTTPTGKGVYGCSCRGRRRPASCIPTPAATGRWWCCSSLSLPVIATLVAGFLTELNLRHVSGLQRPPFPFGALSKRRVPDDLFRSWLHPLRHNPKVRRDLPPQRPATLGQNVVTSLVRLPLCGGACRRHLGESPGATPVSVIGIPSPLPTSRSTTNRSPVPSPWDHGTSQRCRTRAENTNSMTSRMSLDVGALRDLLCARLCEDVHVDEHPDGGLMLRTHFRRRRLSPPPGRGALGRPSPVGSWPHPHAHQLRTRH